MHDNTFPRAYSVAEVCDASGLGRTTIYAAIKSGQLVARKAGMRTIILGADLDAWLQGLPIVSSLPAGSASAPAHSNSTPASSDAE
jgi:excisionase family DNA binding protein